MALELRTGDVVRMKKPHPCGGYQWTVTRLGADIGMVCQECGRYVLMQRSQLARRVKSITQREDAPSPP
jgi:hypothetical protein